MKHISRGLLVKGGVLLAILFAAFLASGVVLAQSSADYDLGCRAELTAGGKWTDYSSPQVRLNSSFGLWNSGRTTVQGSGIVVQSGFLFSSASASSAAQVEEFAGGTTSMPVEGTAVSPNGLYMPAIFAIKAIRFVRPCNWPWASSAAVPSAD